MYIPSANRIDDPAAVIAAMRLNPFATLISVADSVPVATHIPLLIEEGEPIILCGHLARQNQQWKSWPTENKVLVIFAGPHGYVSPRYYESRPNVPTWNYISVHAYGSIEIIEDQDDAVEHLEKLVKTFDPHLAEAQPESTERALFYKMAPGIVMFRITVDRLDAKAKLSQNKSEADRLGVYNQFVDSEYEDERKMAELMNPHRERGL